MKDLIKSVFASNIYLNNILYSMIDYRRNNQLEDIDLKMAEQDFFVDVKQLKKYRMEIENGVVPFYTTNANWSNEHIYGIWESLFGEYVVKRKYLSPSVEHGLILYDDIFTDIQFTGRVSCATFSEFRKKIIQVKKQIPVFCVGPYIRYAQPFYTEEKFGEIKGQLGKTLLVFPTHSTDTSELTINEIEFIEEIRRIAKDYDSVLVNTFWWNINDKLTEYLESEGYRIVSCGFRDDVKFLSRLRSYISFADLVVGNGIGTHIGYCVACGKPFMYIPVKTELKTQDKKQKKSESFMQKQDERIKKAFLYQEEITQDVLDICEYYWGISNEKTKDEMKSIADINKDLIRYTLGFSSLSTKAAKKLLKKYEIENDKIKFNFLRSAI